MNTKLFAWPFAEAEKILKRLQYGTSEYKLPEKGYVLFETGYGPSGLPHIGTFGEVTRTVMVIHALKTIAPDIPTRLFAYSDDLDGLRKVPENIPNHDMVRENIGKPLSAIPDPFCEHESYAHYMNNKLNEFLGNFGFEYEFQSSTEHYKTGVYNEMLHKVLVNCDKILEIMRANLGEERSATYHPILPISPKTGKFVFDGVINCNPDDDTVTFKDEDGEIHTINIFDGNCKLQWKADWALRWAALGVDYEMFGKDIQPSADLSSEICKILGKPSPVQYRYELFTDEEGKKISKSKGNGVSIDDWLKYGTLESLLLFMYEKPETSKKLYLRLIPEKVDAYIKFAQKFNDGDNLTEEEKIANMNNPVFHIPLKRRKISDNFKIDFNTIINIASICNPDNKEILFDYIKKYQDKLTDEEKTLVDELIEKALNFYNDFVKGTKSFPIMDDEIKNKLITLKCEIENFIENNQYPNEAQWQQCIFDIGHKLCYDKTNMKDWFKLLYRNLFGQENGPRFGSFIVIYGVDGFIKMIEERLES